MTELGGLAWLAAGLAGLFLGASLLASCLRVRSPLEHALAAYVLAWAWLVAVTLVLSPPGLVTRGWLTTGIGGGAAGALVAWLRLGRPPRPRLTPAIAQIRLALRNPVLLVLAVVVCLGAGYTIALALFTPMNDADALAYHLPRAAFWNQEHQVGYVANSLDLRLDINPPNAEIGQLATIALSGSDRYVALPQLFAYGVLVLGVAALSRRVGLGVPQSLFGALAFATLPVVAIQASGALNDLVVASCLLVAVVFALRPGQASLLLLASALGLALGTKFTAVLAIPALALVVVLGRPRRDWPPLVAAGLVGAALGSPWYLVNLIETGEPDGGLGDAEGQLASLSPASITTTFLRLVLDLVDLSGAPSPHELLFAAAGVGLAILGLARGRESPRRGAALLAAGVLTASIVVVSDVGDFLQRGVHRAWYVLGKPKTTSFDLYWGLNVEADPHLSWFGPLGLLLVSLGAIVAIARWWSGRSAALMLGLALAPWIVLLTLATTIVWDPFRGRFLVFSVALAAATWGSLLRYRTVAATTAALGLVTLPLALANHQGKPSGLGDVWPRDGNVLPVRSVWSDASRWETQARPRHGVGDDVPLRFVEEQVPADARLAIVARENEFLSPYFGPRLSRRISLVRRGESVPGEAEWLVSSPRSSALRCADAWRLELEHETGWRIERRIGRDDCLS